ncbi:hypothetical protein [Membranihabitans marinus]|nr:hypothetical protein [Membranihabitans marinus]
MEDFKNLATFNSFLNVDKSLSKRKIYIYNKDEYKTKATFVHE